DGAKPIQRRIQIYQALIALPEGRRVIVERLDLALSTFCGEPTSGMIDQDMAHRYRGRIEEMRVAEIGQAPPELEPGLTDQRGGAQRLARSHAAMLLPSDTA